MSCVLTATTAELSKTHHMAHSHIVIWLINQALHDSHLSLERQVVVQHR